MDNKSVLVVEDSSYLAESIADMINLHGHQAVIANNGREGIEKALDLHPDLVLLDIRLPDIEGYEVYSKIRKDDWGKKANVLILTASESIENISKNIDLPNESILFKPEWSIKDLGEKIDSVLCQ